MITSADAKQRALQLGFDLCGIAAAGEFPELARLPDWLARGYGGRMTYLNRSKTTRADVRHFLPSARSVVVVACLYNTDRPLSIEITDPARALIARYAWGDDYHDVIGRRLDALAGWIRDACGPGFESRSSVDAAPVQEKVYAQRAGLGWIGKNTCLISPGAGSWILLGVLACSVPFEPDEPALDRCGSCRLCIEACPAGAIAEPYVLDARRCLSYLTIEVRGSIPVEQRQRIGSHVFGCDVCQEVCPHNALAPRTSEVCWQPRPLLDQPAIETLWRADDEKLGRVIEGTALERAGVRGLRRNLAVAIGNSGQPLPLLAEMGSDPISDPVVAEHLRWARAQPR